jgi:hypothetical protein
MRDCSSSDALSPSVSLCHNGEPHRRNADDSAASGRPAVTPSADPTPGFTSDMLAGVDEPVRRFFSHAIGDGAALPNGVRMAMSGRIKVGLWLPFTAEQTLDGRSFVWRARVGRGPLMPLHVTDRYADAAGSTEGLASRDRQRHPRSLRPAARAPRGSPDHRRTRRDTHRQRPASAGGLTPRATRRSSVPRSTRSRQPSNPSQTVMRRPPPDVDGIGIRAASRPARQVAPPAHRSRGAISRLKANAIRNTITAKITAPMIAPATPPPVAR